MAKNKRKRKLILAGLALSLLAEMVVIWILAVSPPPPEFNLVQSMSDECQPLSSRYQRELSGRVTNVLLLRCRTDQDQASLIAEIQRHASPDRLRTALVQNSTTSYGSPPSDYDSVEINMSPDCPGCPQNCPENCTETKITVRANMPVKPVELWLADLWGQVHPKEFADKSRPPKS